VHNAVPATEHADGMNTGANAKRQKLATQRSRLPLQLDKIYWQHPEQRNVFTAKRLLSLR